jgi:hypothetical protein
MNRDNLEIELKKAGLLPTDLQRSRTAVRGALLDFVARDRKRKPSVLKFLFLVGLTTGFVLGVMFMVALRSSENARIADDLGTVWCTYIDTTDDDAAIWPPHSTDHANNFVKSAPGYGDVGYAIRFKGQVGRHDQNGYMGVAAFLGRPCMGGDCGGVDIHRFKKIRFKMKGRLSGGELVLLISNRKSREKASVFSVNGGSELAYEAKITDLVAEEWRIVTLDLRQDFSRPKKSAGEKLPDIEEVLADARQVKWHVRNGKRAVADVWIDELEFY